MFEVSSFDRSSLLYGLYLRKSTTDETKQSHSIGDQKRECMAIVARLGLEKNIVQVIEESASARYYGNRPKFNQMLKDLEDGKIDGIIAYHPDRLARNMREGGVIIDMLTPNKSKKDGAKEDPILKDLIFASYSFNNDISNRGMLAMQFALATQYSEHLSEVVVRGANSHIAIGHSQGAHKWGYKRDERGFYVPDENFDIIKEAWRMFREDGKNQREVREFLVANDVHYMTKTTSSKASKKVSFGQDNALTHMFRDSFYYGMLCHGEHMVDLREVQPDFKPLQTEEQWNEVQAIKDSNSRKHRRLKKGEKTAIFLPLRGMVFCGVCGSKMVAYRTRGKDKAKHALTYYACQNKHCKRCKRQIRGKDVFDDIYHILDGIEVSEEAFKRYSEAASTYANEQIEELNQQKLHLRGVLASRKAKLRQENIALKNLRMDNRIPKSTVEASIELVSSLEEEIANIETELHQIEGKIKDPAQVVLTKDEFFELLETAGLQMRNGNFAEKDIVARCLFSKLTIDDKNKTTALFKSEFDGLISTDKSRNFQSVCRCHH